MTLLRRSAAALIVAVGLAFIWLRTSDIGQIYLPAGTGITAKQICSLHFVSGLDPARARALYLTPLLGGADRLVSVAVDTDNREVRASMLGLVARQRAVFREGLGCTLVHGSGDFDVDAALPLDPGPTMALDVAHRDRTFDADQLTGALDRAFQTDGRQTLAVVVLHRGHLVAERYADGIGATTPLHGWSMTKSVAVTVAGVLAQRGLLTVTDRGQVPALVDVGHPEITVDQLLRMTGGLAGYEQQNGTDPVSDMLFTESDMAQFAATREQIAPPGTQFDYQSGNTILAGHGLEAFLGGTPDQEIATIRRWLFEPLGMTHSVLETDEAGTLQWSSYMYASARDWARLGQLYLDDGRAPNGEQLIPEDWMDYVRVPTPGSEGRYGAGFWLWQSAVAGPVFYMDGFQGQNAFVVPNHDLVVVRLGATNWRDDGTRTLVHDVIEAQRTTPAN